MSARALAAGLLLAAAVTAAPARADAVNVVEVFNNFFAPQQITIARGETVTWVMREGGHTVTANDARFTFPAEGTSARGETFAWTFIADETFAYRCLVHGPGMSGVVVVGEGSPPPPPPPEPPHRVVPSAAYPTLTLALSGAEPTTIIDVLPGTYHYGVVVTTPDVTIRGSGASPADVVFDGDEQRAVGLDVRADGVRIENLTVRDHGIAGLAFEGVTRFVAEDVIAARNRSYGILARDSTRGAIRSVSASGASSAAIAVEDCDTCDIDIAGVAVHASGVGILLERAGSVVIRRSSITGNGAGILLRGGLLEQRGAHLWRNTITDNLAPGTTGAGIWIDGGAHNLLEENLITGHRYGVVVTGIAGPSLRDRIVDNIVDSSSIADVAWDGLGMDVCFDGNQRSDGSRSTSEPVLLTATASCALPHTVGIPWPLVTARLLTG